ncbi:MAG: hypothetical protein LBG73_10905 [Spirochaetaceae bacterium]|jgi:hypothetical protein|nr:hypothetical protein [Spirochaetaceae bacterium]
MRITVIIVAVLLLTRCVSFETYVDNSADTYDVIPITVEDGFWFFKNRTISILNYTLTQKKQASYETESALYRKQKGGVYTFRGNAEPEYAVEIIGEATGLKLTSSVIYTDRRYMRFQKKGGLQYEVTIPLMRNAELTIYYESIGNVVFRNYRSKNKNDLNSGWEFDAGFTVLLNGDEYGIIAYYRQPAVYLRKGWNTTAYADILMMFMLAVYENYELAKQW